MSMLSAPRLHQLIEEGVIDAPHKHVNSACDHIVSATGCNRTGNRFWKKSETGEQPPGDAFLKCLDCNEALYKD